MLILLAALALGAVAAERYRGGVPARLGTEDSFEYAVMARRLASGEGFTTGIVYPAALRHGVDAQHPAVKLPPLWPLVLTPPFALFGANAEVAQAVTHATFALLVAAATALATAQAGLVAGVAAAVAVATSIPVLIITLESNSDLLFALTLALVWLACALRASALVVGLACGLVYLTRYSGILVLPFALALVFARRREPRALALGLAGFLLVAAPWWIRNALVAGSPFYSLLNLTPWLGPGPIPPGAGLLFEQAPELAPAGVDPLMKLRVNLAPLLARLPLPSANLAAFAGVLLGCLRRDPLCLAFIGACVATLVGVALTLPLGLLFAPLVPVMLALGAAAWVRHGGLLRWPALGLLLLTPLFRPIPLELADLDQRLTVRYEQQRLHERGLLTDGSAERAALNRCLSGRPVVLAQLAPRIVWETDAIAIYAPNDPAAFWRIVEEQPVAFVEIANASLFDGQRFLAEFEPRPDCGPLIWQRRSEPR